MKSRERKNNITVIIEIVIALALFAVSFAAILNIRGKSAEEGRNQLAQSVSRAVMECYAREGVYPQNLEYLKENYALVYDESKYAVIYSPFAENLLPDITVVIIK